jgi:hypothetical protein
MTAATAVVAPLANSIAYFTASSTVGETHNSGYSFPPFAVVAPLANSIAAAPEFGVRLKLSQHFLPPVP